MSGFGEILIYAAPCAKCKCGSYCHWDDTRTPAQGEAAETWAGFTEGIPCQRCSCKGYRRVKAKSS